MLHLVNTTSGNHRINDNGIHLHYRDYQREKTINNRDIKEVMVIEFLEQTVDRFSDRSDFQPALSHSQQKALRGASVGNREVW